MRATVRSIDKSLQASESASRSELISYPILFWVFLLGSVIGYLLEGIWCVLRLGHWESHSSTVWGPFCIVYGLGAVAMHCLSVWMHGKNQPIRFCAFALAGTAVEFVSGVFQEICFGTYSWDYSHMYLSIGGKISLGMTLLWGFLGLVFMRWVFPFLTKLLSFAMGKGWQIACKVCTLLMCINLLVTGAVLARWESRNQGSLPSNFVEQAIDRHWDDNWMQKRYPNMRFVEE